MDFIYRRGYRGLLKAAILDWAGTTVDYGSFAPTAVFIKLFSTRGVQIKMEHARGPMGLMKKDHLRSIAFHPEVKSAWEVAHGQPVTEADVDEMFADFVPMQMDCLAEYAQVIPGVPSMVESFHRAGMKIGSTTGYTREMMEVLVPAARANGYCPDAWVSATDVPAGRPYPWMAYQNIIQLGVFPMEACVKIGDTLVDIEEGLNAGMWTVGLTLTGNMLGLTEAEAKALPQKVLDVKRKAIAEQFYKAGAHFVADGLADCLDVVKEINFRLWRGDRP